MVKRVGFFLNLLLFGILIISFVSAIEEEDIFEGYEDATLKIDAGTTPDSAFYFIDKFFDRFGNELDVKEERIAEIKAMIESGNIEAAREALKEYIELADEFEREVSPDRRDDALRSAAAIRNAMRDIQEKVSPGERDEFVRNIMEREHSIATAAEIAKRINELCRELSNLDPELFYESCKAGDDGPRWHKKMFDDLTDEQKIEARKFAEIMGQCFKTSGKECRCEEIPYESFADTCSIAAPLATACDIEGNEEACEKLDNLDMPELPPHLQDVMDELEGNIKDEKFDLHFPEACREAGIKMADRDARKKCGRIMIEKEAPPECREALIEADVQSEREGREICERIMMKKYAPACVKKGITDPEECKDFMWNINKRPDACRENKIHDYNDCKKFLEGDGDFGGPGPRIDFNCMEIENPEKRLVCYDRAASNLEGYHDVRSDDYGGPCMTDRDWEVKKQKCRDLYGEHAGDEPIMGDSGDGYECPIDIKCIDFGKRETDEGIYEGCGAVDCFQGYHCEYGSCVQDYDYGVDDSTFSECKDGCSDECPGADRTECVDGGTKCACYYNEDTETGGIDGSGASVEEEIVAEETPVDIRTTVDSNTGGSADTGTGDGLSGVTGNFFLNYWFG